VPGVHCGRPPRNKGRSYPADPPTVEEIVAVMRAAGDRLPGLRTRALIVLLWRAGLRINEALPVVTRCRPSISAFHARRKRLVDTRASRS
jgi:site-specific recombinase XerD